MIEQNKAEFDKSNITYWRDKGYTGKGVNIVILDDNGLSYPRDNIIEPLIHLDRSIYDYNHKTRVTAMTREVLSNTNIYAFNWFADYKDEIIDWIKANKDMIDFINCSFNATQFSANKLMQLKDLDIPIFAGVGNDGKPYSNLTSELEFVFGIGMWGEAQDRKAVGSNYGLNLDFMAYTGIYYHNSDNTRVVQFYGTSCSSPYAMACAGYYAEWFRTQYNRPMNTQECFEFLLENVDDKDEIGRDDNSGYGLIKLPDKIPTLEKPIEPPIIKEPEKEIDTMEFKDTKGHWGEQDIDFLVEKGLMQGYPDGTFQPDRALTRAEYASMKAKELGFVKKK